MIFDIGPFRFHRSKNNYLSVSLKMFEDKPFGFEWGWRDVMKGEVHPLVDFRIGKLQVFYFEKFKKGFEFWFMGFWGMV